MKVIAAITAGLFLILPICANAAPQNAVQESASSPAIAVSAGAHTAQILREYHGRVGELARETEARLHEISGQISSGEISAAQGQALKLAATRSMLARLQTLVATYEARINRPGGNATVSVEELLSTKVVAKAAR